MAEEEQKQEKKAGIGGKLAALGGSLGKAALIAVIVIVSSIGGGVVSWILILQSGLLPETSGGSHSAQEPDIREMMEHGAVVGLDPFVVNLADTDAPRYLRVTINLMVDDKTIVGEVTENPTMLSKTRDVILQTLSRKRSDELINEEGKNHLRAEILERLEPFYHAPRVVDVMFTEFVIQL